MCGWDKDRHKVYRDVYEGTWGVAHPQSGGNRNTHPYRRTQRGARLPRHCCSHAISTPSMHPVCVFVSVPARTVVCITQVAVLLPDGHCILSIPLQGGALHMCQATRQQPCAARQQRHLRHTCTAVGAGWWQDAEDTHSVRACAEEAGWGPQQPATAPKPQVVCAVTTRAHARTNQPSLLPTLSVAAHNASSNAAHQDGQVCIDKHVAVVITI